MSVDSEKLIIEKLDILIEMFRKKVHAVRYEHKYECNGVKWSGRGAWPLPYRKAISSELGNSDFDSISKEDRKKVLEKYLLVQ